MGKTSLVRETVGRMRGVALVIAVEQMLRSAMLC